jgi:hypothetical protein
MNRTTNGTIISAVGYVIAARTSRLDFALARVFTASGIVQWVRVTAACSLRSAIS